ncbi:hypothetical protein Q8W71_19990 [Methylobacterium sp. NEAU 140]|uniref:hypothetical protein n=1 Tax=Methylobacterium sp. NEAU 140 TaxID=3064945 RepID=UPI002733ADD9|nr:hypothetical protein [Methylobacterium sp. NEAU 140]MDP4024916.1 hypothetical protein [Methylobacterium sp. NEAU 140]
MSAAAGFDQGRLAALAQAVWRRGGLDTLVKVAPFGTVPDPARPIGYCTTLKYVVGRTPAQMEGIVGLADDSKLRAGAEIFTVAPLPAPGEFDLRGYTQCPGGVPTDAPGYVAHPIYPPGLGAPQWDLARVPQSQLVWLASVPRGQTFRYEARRLPPIP